MHQINPLYVLFKIISFLKNFSQFFYINRIKKSLKHFFIKVKISLIWLLVIYEFFTGISPENLVITSFFFYKLKRPKMIGLKYRAAYLTPQQMFSNKNGSLASRYPILIKCGPQNKILFFSK